jgi:hypothetical protein
VSGDRLGSRGIDALRRDLGDRELAIIDQVADLRLMSTPQIEAIYFSADEHGSALSAARTGRRVLAGLTAKRVLGRLERRIGGLHGGSASWIYAIGPVGHRLLDGTSARPRFREPSALFVDHTLAISQLVTDLRVLEQGGDVEVLQLETEPRCWRDIGNGREQKLKPDLYVLLASGELEHSWFVEIDRATAHLPALRRKCLLFQSYYQSGREQAQRGVFPRVCWVVPDTERATRIKAMINDDGGLTRALFTVVTNDAATALLSGGAA